MVRSTEQFIKDMETFLYCQCAFPMIYRDPERCGRCYRLLKDSLKEKMDKALRFLRRVCIPHSTEDEMQLALQGALTAAGFKFEREARLSPKDRVDFLLEGGVAVECKVKGPAMAVFNQVERYAKSWQVNGIILLTAFHMSLPDKIDGKPCAVVKVGQAWL